MKSICRMFLLAAFGIFTSSLIAGQPDSTLNQIYQNTPRGLQFSINDYLNLGSFNGRTISYVKWIDPTHAIRWGVDFSGNANTNHRKSTYSYYDADTDTTIIGSQSSNGGSPNQTDLNLKVSRAMIYYGHASRNFGPYWGCGPYIQSSYSRQFSDNYYEGITTRSTMTDVNLGLGIAGLVGVEWFLLPNLSLHMEYVTQAGVAYSTSKSESKGIYSTNDYTLSTVTDHDTYGSVSSRVLFGLTVRF